MGSLPAAAQLPRLPLAFYKMQSSWREEKHVSPLTGVKNVLRQHQLGNRLLNLDEILPR